MSGIWLKHLAGFRVDEERLAVIPHPRTELTLHIIGKCIQASSIIGLGIVGPVSAIRSGQKSQDAISESAVVSARKGALVGAAIGPLLAGVVLCIKDKTQVYDFCYRIRFNRRAMRIDRYATLFASGGAGLALALGKDTLTGAVLGLTGGVALAGVCNIVLG